MAPTAVIRQALDNKAARTPSAKITEMTTEGMRHTPLTKPSNERRQDKCEQRRDHQGLENFTPIGMQLSGLRR
jgi:hypothetical protein